MNENLMVAHRQWASRPADERYTTIQSLLTYLLDRTERSTVYPSVSTDRILVEGDNDAQGGITVKTPEGVFVPTHWSFGQLVSESAVEEEDGGRATPSARWCRAVHPAMAAVVLNYGLRVRPRGESNLMTLHHGDGDPETLRAITAPSYGRIYDHQVVDTVAGVNEDLGGTWHVPAASGADYRAMSRVEQRQETTLYAGDRDVWVMLVDEAHPVEVPRPDGGSEVLSRGFIVYNSEVRARRFGLMTFLYRWICANRIIWGAEEVTEFTIRHTSGGPERFRVEGADALRRYMERSAADESRRLRRAMEIELARGKDESVQDWLRKQQFTLRQAKAIVERAEQEEGQAVTLWDIVNGGTALARDVTYADQRVELEQRVSNLLRFAA